MSDYAVRLPDWLQKRYQAATSHDVHSWSFGHVKVLRRAGAQSWKERQDTLDCERIFGPLSDYECACGKYKGKRYNEMGNEAGPDWFICDVCGVKVTSRSSRRQHFGHIELNTPVHNAFLPGGPLLEAFPVLPADFRQSVAGAALNPLYESMLQAPEQDAPATESIYHRLIDIILPALLSASAWDLAEADILAHGLGLTRASIDLAGTI